MSSNDKNNTNGNDAKPEPKCVPCESLDKSMLLKSGDELKEKISTSIPLWTLSSTGDVNKITRKFTAKNFQAALNFLNEVGQIAEREGHHPDLHLTSYRDVEVTLFTHSVGGLTQNDIGLAEMIDKEVKVSYSPKFLRENPEVQGTAL
mmetsp:Transcript_15117/g.19163  ORF Transcript_15117/g.19163 Transcript_15117/m.19163 type:complete len:148 (-) Transcript_15117:503-946(-)|eukprot:CAMPEP_0203643514 /NCGR_PEP_ID=MMETSP0088-20131115/8963_1 /ASSEMBLY_ACC=CAM_ASM_001087 /TAXON_ID=426623 /ORGANISM="Chaetoceros affinis, Strain CCMP159" /LENGTH=147 /DNA_ID=CAMNT_0050499715 /DNA_START=185 /DNA_END=628 /DNA_ORIENTATION=+